jgi:uncharacterized small protein (DUF1192 family)
MTGGDAPRRLGGGGGSTEEEVPPPEGLPVPSVTELMAQIAALMAENEALKAAKGTEDPQGEKGQ